MWALIIVTTFFVGDAGQAAVVQQEFVTKELCVQAANRLVPKLKDGSGNVRISECVFTGVR